MPRAASTRLSEFPVDQLERALELSGLAVWLWEPDSGRIVVSRQLAELYGTTQDNLADMDRFYQHALPEDRATAQKAVQDALAGKGAYVVEYRVRHDDGSIHWLQSRGRLLPGAPKVVVGTMQEITQLRELEAVRDEAAAKEREAAQLRELNEFKARFINIAAHELKTPLTPMRIQLAILREVQGAKLDDQQRKSLDVIHRNLERLTNLIEDVLQAARIQAHSLKVDAKPLDVGALLRAVGESFEAGAQQVGVRLVVESDADVRVEADAARLEQVIANLVTNALKFTPDGGRVVISARTSGRDVVLTVQDNGIGMTQAQLDKLFLPFSQVHDDPAQRLRGTGLGLFICKGIVEEHGGSIHAESAGPLQGTRFVVRLPGTRKAIPAPPPAPRPTTARRFRELI